MTFTPQPTLETKCSITGCTHILGEHYTTHDGRKDGCGHLNPGYDYQRDFSPASMCMCTGFAMTYRPVRPAQPAYSSRGNEQMQIEMDSYQPGGARVAQQWDR